MDMAIRSTVDPTISRAVSPSADSGAAPPPTRGERSPEPLFDPAPDGTAAALARRFRTSSPLRAAAFMMLASYLVLSALMIGVGWVLTRIVFPDHPARSDIGTDRFFADHRTHLANGASWLGSHLAETAPVIAIAAAVVLLLLWVHRPLPAAFLASALVLEVTAFLTATLVIDRARPDVARLDSAPPTSSFPSGHSAAAVALYAGLALIVTSITTRHAWRVTAWIVAIGVPLFVGVSRLYRGMHFATDVFAGLLLGSCAIVAALLVVRTGVAAAHEREHTTETVA
jgi:undecaprenyl-diphosphatase